MVSIFDAGEPILSGDLIYEISFPGIEGQPAIFHHDLSEEAQCPVPAGNFVLIHTELLPSFTPSVSSTLQKHHPIIKYDVSVCLTSLRNLSTFMNLYNCGNFCREPIM